MPKPLSLAVLVGFALLLSVPGSRIAISGSESEAHDLNGTGSSGTAWNVHADYRDGHAAAHGQFGTGQTEVVAFVASAPSFKKTQGFGEGPNHIYSVKLVASLSTPLSGLVRAEARWNGDASTGPIGWYGGAYNSKTWTAESIQDAQGQWYLAWGRTPSGGKTHVGHKDGDTARPATVEPPDEYTTIPTHAVPEVVVDEETGEVREIVRDANGDIVWEVPPATQVRLTSQLVESGGVYTYTYKVENFGDDAVDFVIPEVTAPAFPSGWYGTVGPSSYEQITLDDTDSPYRQHATLSVTETYDEEISSEQITTGEVFVPESRLVFGGTNTVTNAYYDTVTQANVIEFMVSEAAALGILLRIDTDGELGVDEIQGLSAGMPFELTDATFLPGENEYRVRTGSGVNGWEQEGVVTVFN